MPSTILDFFIIILFALPLFIFGIKVQPLYNKKIVNSDNKYLAKKRISRAHYIYNYLFIWILLIFGSLVIEFGLIIGPICGIYLAVVTVRRLHDINMSGWWWIISIIPFANLNFYNFSFYHSFSRHQKRDFPD